MPAPRDVLHRLQPHQMLVPGVETGRRLQRVGEPLALGQQRADRRLQHVVDPGERERAMLHAARDAPAIEPGERAFVRNHVADVRARATQLLDLLRPVVAEHQRRTMRDEQRGRFFGQRVVGEQVAPQVDQLACDGKRLRGRQAKRLGIAEGKRGERKIVLRAVEIEHLAAVTRVPQRQHRVRRDRHLLAVVDQAHRRIGERNRISEAVADEPADRVELLEIRQLPPAVRDLRKLDRREQAVAHVTLDLGGVRRQHVVRRRRRAVHAAPQRLVRIDEGHFDARMELRLEGIDDIVVGIARPREHTQHVVAGRFGRGRGCASARHAQQRRDEQPAHDPARVQTHVLTHADSPDQSVPARVPRMHPTVLFRVDAYRATRP